MILNFTYIRQGPLFLGRMFPVLTAAQHHAYMWMFVCYWSFLTFFWDVNKDTLKGIGLFIYLSPSNTFLDLLRGLKHWLSLYNTNIHHGTSTVLWYCAYVWIMMINIDQYSKKMERFGYFNLITLLKLITWQLKCV